MYNRRLVFWAACLGMLMFGIVMTTLGAILPSVLDKLLSHDEIKLVSK